MQHLGQKRQAEPEADEGGRPQRLDGAGEAGHGGRAVQQHFRAGAKHRQARHHAEQVFQAVADAHDRERHGVGGVALHLVPAHRPVPHRHHVQRWLKQEPVLAGNAFQHEHREQQHEQPDAGVAQAAFPHREHHHQRGSQQQQAFAAVFAPFHHHAAAQKAQRQHQTHIGDGPRQRHAHRQRGQLRPGGQKGEHQLGQRQTHRGHHAAHHPHGQAAQRAAPHGAARRKPAANGSQHHAQRVDRKGEYNVHFQKCPCAKGTGVLF